MIFLLQFISSEVFTACLIDLSKALWEVMKSYHKTMQWHEQHEGDSAQDSTNPGEMQSSTSTLQYMLVTRYDCAMRQGIVRVSVLH